jgi:hypothetical protein
LALGEGYSNVELWIEPVAKAIKVLLVIAVLAGATWLAIRTWKKHTNSH